MAPQKQKCSRKLNWQTLAWKPASNWIGSGTDETKAGTITRMAGRSGTTESTATATRRNQIVVDSRGTTMIGAIAQTTGAATITIPKRDALPPGTTTTTKAGARPETDIAVAREMATDIVMGAEETDAIRWSAATKYISTRALDHVACIS